MSDHGRNLRSRTKAAAATGAATPPASPAKRPASEATPAVQPTKNDVDPHSKEEELEFGGPIGTFAMMTGFPILFYYLYVCLYFYDGAHEPLPRVCHASLG
jgi:delta24(24(1))-sterol reductase